MAGVARAPLMLGDDGLPQQQQAVDTAAFPGPAALAAGSTLDGLAFGIRTANQAVISASASLDRATYGGKFILIVTSGVTVTLPSGSGGYKPGEGFVLKNVSGGTVTLAYAYGGDGRTSLPDGASCFFFTDGNSNAFWRAFGYSAG